MASTVLPSFKNWLKAKNKVFLLFFAFSSLTVFSLFIPFKTQAAINTDSLLGYWKFDSDGSDSSGDGSTVIIAPAFSSTVAPTTFPNSRSAIFTGPGSNITMANQNGLQPLEKLSISFWLYLNSYPTTQTVIAGNYLDAYNGGFYFSLGTANTYFSAGNGTSLISTSFPATQIPLTTWTHITGIWDGTTLNIYLNGTLKNSVPFTGPISYSSTTFRVGNFNGLMDDLRLYKHALSSTEINALSTGQHTKTDWTGTISSDYENPNNWSTGIIPDPYTLITIPVGGNYQPTFTASEYLAGLTIDNGAALNLSTYNLTIKDAGNFSNNGTLRLANTNTQSLTGFTNDTDSGTVIIGYSAATTGLKTGNNYYNLTINNTAGTTVTASGTTTIHGNLTIQGGNFYNTAPLTVAGDTSLSGGNLALGSDLAISGNLTIGTSSTLSASTSGITLGGNWINTDGTFTSGTGTVILSGTNQQISGNNTFYNLSKSISSTDVLTFLAGSTQIIQNTLTLQGAGISSQFLSLRSSSSGTQWNIDPRGTRDISGVNVKDSNNINATVITTTGINVASGNNTNWTITTSLPPTISSVTATPGIDTASVTWTTDQLTSSLLEYGTTSAYGTSTAEADVATKVSSHTVSLSGLTACTLYHYRVHSIDTSSQESISADYTFTTTGCPNTTTPTSDSGGSCSLPDKAKFTDAKSPDANSIKLYFDKPDGKVDHFEIKYGKNSDDYSKKIDDIDDNKDTYLIEDLSPDTTYYFKIRAVNDCGDGEWSSDISQKTKELETPTTTSTTSSVNTSTKPAPSTTTSSELSSSTVNSATPSLETASTPESNFNDQTSSDWQSKYFGEIYCLNETRCGGTADPDNDGLTNNQEFQLGTDPLKADSDQDGLSDSVEIESGHNPLKAVTNQEDDQIVFEDPREKGETKEETYKVEKVEMVLSEGKKKLHLSGKGSPNSWLTLYIHSDPIVLTVKTDSDGNWSYILDQELEDGEHQVYVAVTSAQGKISEKSAPLGFVKTAEAVSIIPPAEASATNRAQSPVQSWYEKNLFFFIAIGIGGLILAITTIGLIKYKKNESNLIN